ncbi:MAG: arginine--tRNA ligase [bacterium]
MKREISILIEKTIKEAQEKGLFAEFSIPEILVEASEEKTHGDYASNIALKLAGIIQRYPMEIAEIISNEIKTKEKKIFTKIEVLAPGFLNFFLSENYLQNQIKEILKEKDHYGDLKIGKNKKVQVEFISANPTGPLTIGNARGGFFGDVLGNVLAKAGFNVEKAYYVNDYGMQILALGHSVLKDEQAVYKGDYIEYLNKKIKEKDPYRAGETAAKTIIEEMIKKTVAKMGIEYYEWISETGFHKQGLIDKILADFKKKGLTYEQDGALWFRSTDYGDNRDRVLVKKDGWKTYLAGDAGLHYYKFSKKKFSKVINIWGADHYGDVAGLQAVVEALGAKGKLEILLLQFVTLMLDGEVFKVSKRKGTYVTIDDLMEMINVDVARFFFLMRSPDTHFNFDINLAKEQSEKNPVYYVQYAHARICSIIKKIPNCESANKLAGSSTKFDLLKHPSELSLVKLLIQFPEIIAETTKDYQVQRLPQYALELATGFHQFYCDCRVICDDKELSRCRTSLIMATKIVLKNTLGLIGVSAPEKM